MRSLKTSAILDRFHKLARRVGAPVEFYEGGERFDGTIIPPRIDMHGQCLPLVPGALVASAVDHLRDQAAKLTALADAIEND